MQALLAVTTAAARAMSKRDQAECRLVTQSLPMVAACLTANHKELPATALSCLDALLGEHTQTMSHTRHGKRCRHNDASPAVPDSA